MHHFIVILNTPMNNFSIISWRKLKKRNKKKKFSYCTFCSLSLGLHNCQPENLKTCRFLLFDVNKREDFSINREIEEIMRKTT